MKPEQLSEFILKEKYESIYNQTSEFFKNEISLTDLKTVIMSFNKEVKQYNFQSKIPMEDGNEYTWVDNSGTKGILAIFDSKHTIIALQFLPLEAFPETDQQWTENEFILPIKEKWFTFWGGNNELINYHYPYESQRYAIDLVIMDKNQTYAGNPSENENYYAFGKEVAAPAEGTIVEIENNIVDNKPGEMNEENPSGNYVVIDHGNNEYSILVHFKQYSIQVMKGDKVKTGDLLGLCGNSGHSSEAHIHFQVSNSPNLEEGRSIRIRFKNNIEPIRGDFVESFTAV